MKKNWLASIVLFIVSLIILAIPAFATPYSSDQIRDYTIDVSCGTNTIDVKFSVSGNTTMNKLGCERISVYEKVGDKWEYLKELTLTEDDTGMSKYNSSVYRNTVYRYRSSEKEYKVVVTIFAADSHGRDTRTKTFYV